MSDERFTIHTIEGHISTLYLAVYSDKILILDGGCRCDIPVIENYIKKKLNRNIRDVKLVIASHSHPDHGAGSPYFTKKHAITLAAPKYINSWYKNAGGFIQHKIDTLLGYYVAFVNKKPFKNMLYNRRVDYDIPLVEGMELPGFEDWVVYDTPGHTSHDIVLYNEKNETLYAADVILRVNGKFLLPFPVPLRSYMSKSLKKLAVLKVKTLLLAHGGKVTVSGLKDITKMLENDLGKKLHPAFKKLIILENFSPEIKRAKKREQ
jgi:glyoxylase-like metal-dependent hydrolase (beta-lactamase superfamily II)